MNPVPRRPWTCLKCLRRLESRSNSTAAATATATVTTTDPVTVKSSNAPRVHVQHLEPSTGQDKNNKILRDVFNSRDVWKDFSMHAKHSSGLIGNFHLTDPKGFQRFADASLRRCKRLVRKAQTASSVDEYKDLPRNLDLVSDLLCRVIDLSDFIRTIHPDSRVAAAASAAYSSMFQYMNELNTTTVLYSQLKKAWEIKELHSIWTEEEKMIAVILMKDFAKSGIHLPDAAREEFVNVSNDIANVGNDFVNSMEPEFSNVRASRNQLTGIDPRYLANMSRWTHVDVPVYSTIAKHVMLNAHNSDIKKKLYCAERTASRSSVRRLEQLLLNRAKLAKLTGYESYAHSTLTDKMSKNPEAVVKFLQSLNSNNKGQVQTELTRLLDTKRLHDPAAVTVEPWELKYLGMQTRLRTPSQVAPHSKLLESAHNYFAVGHVIQGLSVLFQRLYGVSLVPRETKLGEVWHPEVRRLDVLTEDGQHIATMYCDLFSRPGKLPNPAHFTLVCSREITQHEIAESQSVDEPVNLGLPMHTKLQDDGSKTYHQCPIIALVCDFTNNSGVDEPSTLSPSSVTTLFHEMGHAVHSILGQTSMQGISGTRCATDFAELPSVLMEYFATDPAVLKLFARHWRTGELIPDELILAMQQAKQHQAEQTGGWDNQTQILMALLDQVYHAAGPVHALERGVYDSTAEFHNVWNTYSMVREPAGTAWQGFFGHLYGYGATYYAYLFDRAIARQVWRAVFKDGQGGAAIDRHAGERLKQDVLKWGGGRDPWLCLEALMGEGQGVLAEGGAEAMDLVGKWGVGASSEGQM